MATSVLIFVFVLITASIRIAPCRGGELQASDASRTIVGGGGRDGVALELPQIRGQVRGDEEPVQARLRATLRRAAEAVAVEEQPAVEIRQRVQHTPHLLRPARRRCIIADPSGAGT